MPRGRGHGQPSRRWAKIVQMGIFRERSFLARGFVFSHEAVRDWARIAEPVDEFLYFMLRESEVVTRLRAGAMECLAGVAAPAMCDAEIARVVALAEHPQVPAWCRDAIGVESTNEASIDEISPQ